ncbi:hypothetical protein B0H13DRAFT_1854928 [Mycena leptocephala]|nr:hypothetical protein B0H13DRAFT_1854928 [Mycena leptocephala]
MSHNAQAEAKSLLEQLVLLNKMNMEQSDKSVKILMFIMQLQKLTRSNPNLYSSAWVAHKHVAPTAPETPRRVRIAREIDCVLAKRVYLGKQHVTNAQYLGAQMKACLPPILRFLEAARRTADEQFLFPDTEITVLESLHAVRGAIDAIEDMVRTNRDLDGTEQDTDAGDAEKTRIEGNED